MGHLLPVNIEIKKFDEDSEEEEIDSDKENSCKKMYLETPMKLNPLSRSPLQDITPSIRKKSKHKLTSFTYEVISELFRRIIFCIRHLRRWLTQERKLTLRRGLKCLGYDNMMFAIYFLFIIL